MNKYQYNLLEKEISKLSEALEQDLCPRDRRKLSQRKAGLELLRNSELAKGYGVML